MPVEIKELTISVSVSQQNNTGTAAVAPAGTTDPEEKQMLVKGTVEEVLRILENKKER